jgi:drug/metabolite transporter (DMT)-like permease
MISAWILLALLSAFTLATSDALTKRALETCNEYLVAWFRLLFSLPILIAYLLLFPRPKLDYQFFRAFIFALPLEILSVIFYIKALRLSPLSLTLPFLSLTPVFVIVVSYALLGEKVSLQGMTGILFIAAGSYVLHIHELNKGILDPIKAIVMEKGSVLMILVALIYSITSPLGKMAIQHSSPLFFGATYVVLLTLFFTPVALWQGRHDIRNFVAKKYYRGLAVPGIFYSIMVASHMMAISLTHVAYMISVKRTSVLIGVLYGYFLFREKHIKERLAGAIIMFVGFVMIVTAQ